MSLVSPFLKTEIVQRNSVVASDSFIKINDAKTIEYFTVKSFSAGPVEDNLKGAIIVINYEASQDRTINSRKVYNILDLLSDLGGFTAIQLVIVNALMTSWARSFLKAFLVSKIF